jgi:hypothetical protein
MSRQYTLPQVIVQQDFSLIAAAATQDLLSVIVGPRKKLINLSDPNDSSFVSYGNYDYTSDVTHSIKGLNTTDFLETNSVKVFFRDVLAKYATLSQVANIKIPTNSQRGRLTLGDSIVGGFSEFSSFSRASAFGNRDVRVGDRLSITHPDGVVNTRIIELVHDVVAPAVTAPAAPSTNTGAVLTPSVSNPTEYIGTRETIYEVRVVKGGLWASNPQVIVTTNNGVDSYGVQTVTSKDELFNLGTLGLKASFGGSATGLTLGNIYYFSVTPSSRGATRTVRLADPLPSSVTTSTDLTVNFYIFMPQVEIFSRGYPVFGSEAWTIQPGNRSILIESDIQVVNSGWVDGSGERIPMDVHGAKIFIEYSAIVRSGSNVLQTFSSLNSVQSLLGEVVPENPLAYGVYKALLNSGGRPVFGVAVESDDLSGYTTALQATEGEVKAYYMVPLTRNDQIIQLFKGHVLSMSDPEKAMERVAIVNNLLNATVTIYGTNPSTLSNWVGYVELGSSAENYNLVTVPGASFLSDGVRVGDVFRSNFRVNNFGNTLFDSFTITNIIDETRLELQTPAFTEAVGTPSVPRRIQIVRSLTKDEQASAIAEMSSKLGHRRVINIWPDSARDGGKSVSGVFVAAAVAGLKSSVAPHQPLTNVTLDGFEDITRSSSFFTPTQLNTIAGGGTWIITKVSSDDTNASRARGSIITRHQLTTDYTDDNMAEVSITTNLDSISKWLRDDLRVIIGQYNNHPYMINLIRTRIEYRLTYLQGHARTQKAGPQLISYKVNKVSQDELIRTKVNADVDLTLPYPINNINLKLTVV